MILDWNVKNEWAYHCAAVDVQRITHSASLMILVAGSFMFFQGVQQFPWNKVLVPARRCPPLLATAPGTSNKTPLKTRGA